MTERRAPHGCIGIDVDKVLHLKKIVEATGARIVLTSTWKAEWDKNPDLREPDGEYLNDVLEAQDLGILDKTEDKITDRGHGIVRWLSAHPQVTSWVVLDDDVFPDYEECGVMPHLVKTHFYTGGLTKTLADKAIDILEA